MAQQIATIGKQAPLLDVKLDAVVNGEITQVALSDYTKAGKWVVLAFYPLAYTFACVSELIELQEQQAAFAEAGAQVVGCSVDSVFTTNAWMDVPRKKGGIQGTEYPIISDLTHKIGIAYNTLMDSGHHSRSTILIDPTGTVRAIFSQDPPSGRNVSELVRLVEAYKFAEQSGGVCPARWTKTNNATIVTDPKGKLEFFEKTY